MNELIKKSFIFEQACSEQIIKISYIRHIGNEWVIFSEKGRRLGSYPTKEKAKLRLNQIEMFKHIKKKKASHDEENNYSAIMRHLVKEGDKEKIKKFQEDFKKTFDEAYLNGEEEPENIAFQAVASTIIKNAAAIDLGDPEFAGRYLADMIKFILRRISADRRPKSIQKMKTKIYYINEFDIASKKVPASSSMGNAITLLKTILLDHKPAYIRAVLNSIVRHL